MTPVDELSALHAAMSPWARVKLLQMARAYAKAWPAKQRNHLKLVSRGGDTVSLIARPAPATQLKGDTDYEPPSAA